MPSNVLTRSAFSKGLLPASKWAGPEAENAVCGHSMGPGHPRAKQRQPESPCLLSLLRHRQKEEKLKKLSGFPVSARTVVDVNLEEEIRIRQK